MIHVIILPKEVMNVTMTSQQKRYPELPILNPTAPTEENQTVLPVYDTRGRLRGAFIANEWWWPEDIKLLLPDLHL